MSLQDLTNRSQEKSDPIEKEREAAGEMSDEQFIPLSSLVYGYHEWFNKLPKPKHEDDNPYGDPAEYFATPEAQQYIKKIYPAPSAKEEGEAEIAKLRIENAELLEECERLAGLVRFWQTEYYILDPPQEFGKSTNL